MNAPANPPATAAEDPGDGQNTARTAESTDTRPDRRIHRPESPDGLEEYGGDFRSYAKPDAKAIGDIMSRRRRNRPPAVLPGDPGGTALPAGASGGREPSPADAARQDEDSPVRLRSNGRTLIVGRDAERVAFCGRRLAERIPCLMLVEIPPGATDPETDPSEGLLHGADVRIRGCLGNFQATARIGSGRTHLSRLLEGRPARFDQVLDLRSAGPADRELLPPGYYTPAGDDEELERALGELPLMIGVFEKPRAVGHRPDRCAHVRSISAACGRCLDICPAGALAMAEGSFQVDHAACLGCGICAAVCPTGAMRCLQPSAGDLLTAVRGRLAEAGRTAPSVIFRQPPRERPASEDGREPSGGPALIIPVDRVGCVGPEVWLGALACGAGQVVVELPTGYPDRLRNALSGQLAWVSAVLEGLHLSAGRVRITDCGDWPEALSEAGSPVRSPAGFSFSQPKRGLIRDSVAHLAGDGRSRGIETALPEGAPFGAVTVDPSACTLCLACAGACPAAALSAPGGSPALKLIESECIQCGRCREICPEHAVALMTRMVTDPARSESARTLFSEEPFACTRCGRPFAPPGLLAKLTERLEGHWMYRRDTDILRLKMCRDCRVRDLFRDRESKGTP